MSAGLKIVKKRIKSAQNIGQITKAMEMVAASKMKKAQKKALASKPYSEKIYDIVALLMQDSKKRVHPLLKSPKADNKPLLILLTTNRGLCGSLNLNLLRALSNFLQVSFNKETKFDFVTIGQKGLTQILKMGYESIADFSDYPEFARAIAPITRTLTQRFVKNKNTSVWLVYNDFINALKQEPKFKKILPLTSLELNNKPERLKEKVDFLIEPSPEKVLKYLFPYFLEAQVREAVLEAEASEYSARMLAMKNATENANELVDGLTLEYNKARQQAVTNEISDIVTAKISMEVK